MFGDIFRAYADFPQKPKRLREARSFIIVLPRVTESLFG